MLLTVDIGNTNVVMGLMPTRGELASQLRFPTDKRRTVREFMDASRRSSPCTASISLM